MNELANNFHFLRPEWLLALPPLVLLIYLWIRRTRQRSPWSDAIAPDLLTALLDDDTRSSTLILRTSLYAGALFTCLALAGPTWERLPQPVSQKNDALVIVLDLSLSMYAEDIAPSRLAKARQKIVDALRLRIEGSTGLVAYAGDGHAVVPITDDSNTIENLLSSLNPAMMPVLGSRPASGIRIAKELFANAGLMEGRILLLTDGIRRASDISDFRNRAFPISIIGIGTNDGANIPIKQANEAPIFLTDELGQTVVARLNETPLIQAAQQSYGRYSQVTISDKDLLVTLAVTLPSEDATIEVEREFDVWADMGFWLCLPLAALMLASFRRGLITASLALLLLPEPSWADASPSQGTGPTQSKMQTQVSRGVIESQPSWLQSWRSLWLRPDQQGHEFLQRGEAAKAAGVFEHPQWRGSALYQSGDYSAALEDFRRDPSQRGLYNQANAMAKMGRYADAIARYENVLAKDPQHEDAAFNKALLEELLTQQEQQRSEQDQQQQEQQSQQSQSASDQSESSQGDQQQNADEESQSGNQDETQEHEGQQDPDATTEQNPSDLAQGQDEQQRNEKDEALEQWLRRIPDDPGGLLRRKFQHETNQRLRQGDYSERQDEQIW